MDDAARIRALREQGRIDDAQTERLLAALAGADGADVAGEERSGSAFAEGREGARTGGVAPDVGVSGASAPEPRATEFTATEFTATDSAATDSTATEARSAAAGATHARDPRTSEKAAAADAVHRWARVEMFAGSLRVHVEEGLDAPVADSDAGDVEVEAVGDGWRIAQHSRDGENWIDRLVDGMRRGTVRVRLPAGAGVELDMKGGDVRLDGVPALRGRLLAGDVDARGLRAVDVALDAGDLDLELDPLPGAHRVRMTVGDAEIRLPAGADVAVTGRVSVGDITAPAPLRTTRSTVSERVEGTLGAGSARLSVELVTGDLELVVG